MIPEADEAKWYGPPLRLGRELLCVCGAWKKPGHVNQCSPAHMDLRINWVLRERVEVLLGSLVVSKVVSKATAAQVRMVYMEPLDPSLLRVCGKTVKVSLSTDAGISALAEFVGRQERRLWSGHVTHAEAVARAPVVYASGPGGQTKAPAVPDRITWVPPPAEEDYLLRRVGKGVGWIPLFVYAVEAVRIECEKDCEKKRKEKSAKAGRVFDLFAHMVPRTDHTGKPGRVVAKSVLTQAGEPVVDTPSAKWWAKEYKGKLWRPSRELVKFYLRHDAAERASAVQAVRERPPAIPENPDDQVRVAYLAKLREEMAREDVLAAQAQTLKEREDEEASVVGESSDDEVGLLPPPPAPEPAVKAESASKTKGRGPKRHRSDSSES